MNTVGIADGKDLAQVVSGAVDPARLTLFSVMKDEMGFLPAWLAHHREIGFEQFLILDDFSGDGGFEYLCAQADVVVLRAKDLTFGSPVRYRDPTGALRSERAGSYFKIALPQVHLPGAYVSYLDADEFLILPPGVSRVGEVVDRLRADAAPSVVASVVEFFPGDVAALQGDLPQSLSGLIAAYPYFQDEPLVELRAGTRPEITGKSKTARLFKSFNVKPKAVRKGWHRIWMPSKAKKAQEFQKSARHKTPILLRDDANWLASTHWGNRPPSSEVLLTVAHFVFTAQFAEKIARAQAWGAHANGAAKYRYYAELLDRMQAKPDGFLDAASRRYEGPQQLVDCGLMRW